MLGDLFDVEIYFDIEKNIDALDSAGRRIRLMFLVDALELVALEVNNKRMY